MILVPQSAELVQCTPDADKLIETIARVCYNSEDRMACDCADGYCPKCVQRRTAFLGGLLARGHESVFEHAVATFKLVTDRGITHELVRHRVASYTQASTRYIKYDQGLPVIQTELEDPERQKEWEQGILAAEASYRALLAAGVAPQHARDVLPTCTATTIFVTANFREWRHIFRLRLAQGAHPKIRELMRMALRQIAPRCPVCFADLET